MNLPIPGRDEETRLFQELTAHYDAPAYIRRARQVDTAFDEVVARCRTQRNEWLTMVRTRLGLLFALAGHWDNLQPLLANDQRSLLRRLYADLQPRLRSAIVPTSSTRVLRRAVRELCESIERFNRRWQAFLPTVDLAPVNELREGYNRYYLLEKECALRSARLARIGYRPLGPLTTADLEEALPLLPVPVLADDHNGTS
jgi:hypothetical protein